MNKISKTLSKISKRQRFIIATVILSLELLITTFYGFDQIIYTIPVVLISVYILTYFAILEGITGKEWIMLFIMPLYYSLALVLLYFFIPQRWLTRLPFILIYSVSIYAVMLQHNIFNVGAQKSLQLFRAAFSVNYLFITITAFIIYNLILSFRLNFLINGLLIFIATLPLSIHYLWSTDPKDILQTDIIKYGIFSALIISEISLVLTFIPISSVVLGLFLTSVLYSILGIIYAYRQQMLYSERIREYLLVLGFVIVILILSVSW